MKKYSFEFKKMVVLEYQNGHIGCRELARKHNISSHKILTRWIENYRTFGEDGLKRSRQRTTYSFEFKLNVVELYLSSELSYQELALKVGLTNYSLIARWLTDYRTAGVDALRPRKRGRKKTMDKDKIICEIENSDSDEQKELLKQLQEENLHLKIENAFLKEARRLRLEEEGLLNEQRESSTASEDNSN